MPISVALPAPDVEVVHRITAPITRNFTINDVNQTLSGGSLVGCSFARVISEGAWINDDTLDQLQLVRNHGGVSVEERFNNYGGWECARLRTGAIPTGGAWGIQPQAWYPAFDGAGLAPGSKVEPGSAALWADFHLAVSAGAAFPATAADTTGFMFVPYDAGDGLVNMAAYVPAALNSGGFGVFLNNDGGGNVQFQYISWTPAGVLERVAVSAAIVPNVTAWSTFRFVIIGARGGEAATLRFEANGETILERDFGSAVLPTPQTINPNALRYMIGYELGANWGAANTSGIEVCVDINSSRFTPEGVELQTL